MRLIARVFIDWSTLPAGQPADLTPEAMALPCWRWTGYTDPDGWARLKVEGVSRHARRLMFEAFVGEIPAGHIVGSRCRHRWCLNPAHQKAVTHLENALCYDTMAARNIAKEQCVHGHDYSPENTLYNRTAGGVKRGCRECRRLAYRARKRVRAAA